MAKPKYHAELTVEKMFPASRLSSLDVSPTVRGMTPQDLRDMQEAFTTTEPPKNAKINTLTARDLQNIEDLFAEQRQGVIANFRGFDSLQSKDVLAAAGDSCCCCCTPCCSCSSAATEIHPFAD